MKKILATALLLGSLATMSAYAETGSANATLTLIVPVQTSVTCSGDSQTAPGGGGSTTLTNICTLTGNPNNLASGNVNKMSASTVTLTSGANNLTANLQSSVTSPDSSVTSISGTASGGFNGTLATVYVPGEIPLILNTPFSSVLL